MKFLDVFNEIDKGNYALTDEAIYASLQNGDELIPLYGGNKEHKMTDRKHYHWSRFMRRSFLSPILIFNVIF